jgi:iron complex outermembrane receptor protein
MNKAFIIVLPIVLWVNIAFAQTDVTGVIKDKAGLPVVGANITVRGTNTFAIADANGQFTVSIKRQLPVVFRISFVGYKTQEVPVTTRPEHPLEITLSDDTQLNEVVVTARRRSETAQEVPIPISVVGGGGH